MNTKKRVRTIIVGAIAGGTNLISYITGLKIPYQIMLIIISVIAVISMALYEDYLSEKEEKLLNRYNAFKNWVGLELNDGKSDLQRSLSWFSLNEFKWLVANGKLDENGEVI